MIPRVIIVLGLALLVLLRAPQDHAAGPQATPAAAAPVCNWNQEYHRTLAELGEDEAHWRVTPLEARWGQAVMDEQRAEIDPDVKCDVVSSVVQHEWMHLQQARLYGGSEQAVAFYGSREQMEMAADCGARQLGAIFAPYLVYVSECPAGLVRNAIFLIGYNR